MMRAGLGSKMDFFRKSVGADRRLELRESETFDL